MVSGSTEVSLSLLFLGHLIRVKQYRDYLSQRWSWRPSYIPLVEEGRHSVPSKDDVNDVFIWHAAWDWHEQGGREDVRRSRSRGQLCSAHYMVSVTVAMAKLDHTGYTIAHGRAGRLISGDAMPSGAWMPHNFSSLKVKDLDEFVLYLFPWEAEVKLEWIRSQSFKIWHSSQIWKVWTLSVVKREWRGTYVPKSF